MNNYQKTYRQLLNDFKDVPATKLLIANDVQSILVDSKVVELDDEQFEIVCDYVYDYVVNSELAIDSLVNYIHDAILQDLPIIYLILNDDWDEADKIIYARM